MGWYSISCRAYQGFLKIVAGAKLIRWPKWKIGRLFIFNSFEKPVGVWI